ncbi:MAG TPA: hypothetical protein VMV72_01395 [Verrucomicrobiae bacterium]|nr:hypothetical protein [Verrucomicrobiae bacterium]
MVRIVAEQTMKQRSRVFAAGVILSFLCIILSACGARVRRGSETFPDGARYDGGLRDGQPEGQGVLMLASGTTVLGDFHNGKLVGQGTIAWADGSKFVGEFKDGRRSGTGTLTTTNGSRFVGDFQDGTLNGLVAMTLPSWSNDVGEFLGDNKTNGTDIVIWPDRRRYE